MTGISDEAIRERAYQIWEREGRPDGRAYDHWVQAQVELAAEAVAGNGGGRMAEPSGRRAERKAKPSPAKSAVATRRRS